MSRRLYAEIESVQGVTAVHSNDELFVFVGHSKAVLSGARFNLLVKEWTSRLLVPQHVSDDLLVVHVKGNEISKYDLRGFGYSGSPFIYRNQVYWGRGRDRGDTGSGKWKWDGSKFVALSPAEASPLDYDHIKDIDVLTRQEGWVETSLDHARMTCRVGDKEFRIFERTETTRSGGNHDRVWLVEDGNSNSPEVLIDLPEGYKVISRNEYLKLKQGIVIAR